MQFRFKSDCRSEKVSERMHFKDDILDIEENFLVESSKNKSLTALYLLNILIFSITHAWGMGVMLPFFF